MQKQKREKGPQKQPKALFHQKKIQAPALRVQYNPLHAKASKTADLETLMDSSNAFGLSSNFGVTRILPRVEFGLHLCQLQNYLL
jgi:hypothetical protein